ncbi:DUF433 domain-containing protein [candidate division KSB1 bacterium]|nr:DUF433 domain-containing protein [candidate division KSB1 bacterium]
MPLTLAKEPIPFRIASDGIARIGKTRVTIDTVVTAFLDGETAEEIAQQYPTLKLGDVYSVIGYYLRHKIKIDDYLYRGKLEAAKIRKQNESRSNPAGIRERLLARSAEKAG